LRELDHSTPYRATPSMSMFTSKIRKSRMSLTRSSMRSAAPP
jgi:hypothetical protein